MNLELLAVTGQDPTGTEFGMTFVTDQSGYDGARTEFEDMAEVVFRTRYPATGDLQLVWTDYEDPEGDA